MIKRASLIILFIPFLALSANPPPPGLPDEPPALPIDSMIIVLFIAGIAFGSYVTLKKK